MAKCNREKFLIKKADIKEELFLLEESDCDYITKTGKVYKWYHGDMYYPKKNHVNKVNKYVYVPITTREGQKSRRLHILLAKTFIPNPNPTILNVVGHKDNNKQNNSLDNLYWTTTQENTQKAVDDNLSVEKSGIDNEKSQCVAVYNSDNILIAVYGSIREADRYIENISAGSIAKCLKANYKNRTRKYIYKLCTKEFYYQYPELHEKRLIESKNEKKIRQFTARNITNNFTLLLDNQKYASTITDIPQATISSILRNNGGIYNNWEFKVIKEISYKESSGYKNLISIQKRYIVINIHTNEILNFQTAKAVQDAFGLNGHDLNHYCRTGQTMLGEWKIYPEDIYICDQQKIS